MHCPRCNQVCLASRHACDALATRGELQGTADDTQPVPDGKTPPEGSQGRIHWAGPNGATCGSTTGPCTADFWGATCRECLGIDGIVDKPERSQAPACSFCRETGKKLIGGDADSGVYVCADCNALHADIFATDVAEIPAEAWKGAADESLDAIVASHALLEAARAYAKAHASFHAGNAMKYDLDRARVALCDAALAASEAK